MCHSQNFHSVECMQMVTARADDTEQRKDRFKFEDKRGQVLKTDTICKCIAIQFEWLFLINKKLVRAGQSLCVQSLQCFHGVCLFVCLSDQSQDKSLHIKAGQQLAAVCVCLQQFIYNVFMCSSHYTLNQTAVCVCLEQFIQCVQFPYSVCGAQRSMAKHKMDTIRKLLLST